MQIRKHQDFSNHKILANLVDIFYRIHLKIIKTVTNKKIRTIYTELYVLIQTFRLDTKNTLDSTTFENTKQSSSSAPLNIFYRCKACTTSRGRSLKLASSSLLKASSTKSLRTSLCKITNKYF